MVVKKMDELVKKFNDAVKDDNSISSLKKNSLKKKRSGNKKNSLFLFIKIITTSEKLIVIL